MSYEDRYDAMSDYNAERRGEGHDEGVAEERERILKILETMKDWDQKFYKLLKTEIGDID